MNNYRLIYFDFDGGRGEPIRIALHAAGIEFEDVRLSFAEFGEMRKDTPFNSVPVLEIDGVAVTQSNALCRYAGKMAGLYPEDDREALYCDEVLDALEDVTQRIGRTFGLEGKALRKAREELVDGWLTIFLRGLNGLLERGGGRYFADRRLTVADLKACIHMRRMRSGILEHVPTDLADRVAPALVEHQHRVDDDPLVVAYYASRA